jgi:glycosyltransferase involved in cell wall biosynthesis
MSCTARNEKITIVMPAYNAARTLRNTYIEIPEGEFNEVILVDDASLDDTYTLAKNLGIVAIRHHHNLGYGGNQKTCYTEALRREADIVVMIHPDGQYDPAFLSRIVEPILSGEADIVLGSRMFHRKRALLGGMPRYKYVAHSDRAGSSVLLQL